MQNVSWSVCFCFNVFCFWTYLNCQFFLNSSYRYLVYLNLLCFSFRSADATVRMFDRRSLTSGGVGSPVHKFEGHNAAVLCVQVIEKFWDYFLGFILHHAFCYIFRNRTYLVFFKEICICFQWSPDKSSVFGSSAEDGILNIWDHEKVWSYNFSLYSLALSLSLSHTRS